MREWLVCVTEYLVMAIDAVALLVIAIGTLRVLVGLVPRIGSASSDDGGVAELWLRYARWLVAGLTFQLAADIVETSISTSWEAIGRVAAIAVIRTFLNYFLARDILEVREACRACVTDSVDRLPGPS
jgi:uncharacterized membrane protein